MNRTDRLDGGEWPAVAIDKRAHKVIRHAYEQVLSACARLGSFATGTPTRTYGPIDERQETLAVDDLVDFAIHARRLIENTAKHRRFSGVTVCSKSKQQSELTVLTIINRIIHHGHVEIVRTEWKRDFLAGVRHRIEDILDLPNRSIPPVVAIKSDRGGFIAIDLRELVEPFQQMILAPIIELCEEHDLFLNDDDLFR